MNDGGGRLGAICLRPPGKKLKRMHKIYYIPLLLDAFVVAGLISVHNNDPYITYVN